MSKLSKIANIILPMRDFHYILQLEEYEIDRYLKQVVLRICKRNFEKMGKLQYTSRIKTTYFLVLVALILSGFVIFTLNVFVFILYLILLPFSTPIFIAVCSLCIEPFIQLLLIYKARKAQLYFYKINNKTKIIAITGSYGKTTTKYLLHALLEHTFTTTFIPGNINTYAGIVNYILANNITTNPQFLIVEMGAYMKGDIKKLTLLLPPDIAIITTLGDQHLERFGSFKQLVKTKNEIFKYSRTNTLKYATEKTSMLLREFNLFSKDIIAIETEDGAQNNTQIAVKVAEDLGVSRAFIEDALQNFKTPQRRNAISMQNGITVIDNSYNISPQTAEQMLLEANAFATQTKKKLVVVTAGISEQGTQNDAVNNNFGVQLNTHADEVILFPSVYMPAIIRRLSIPYKIQNPQTDFLDTILASVDGKSEVLLLFTTHTDLSYV